MHHFPDDRTGTDDRHLDHDIVKRRRPKPGEARQFVRGFRPGTCRFVSAFCSAEKTAGSSCGRWARSTVSHSSRRSMQIASSRAAIIPKPKRSTFKMPMLAQSSLSIARQPVRAWSRVEGGQSSRAAHADHHAPRMLSENVSANPGSLHRAAENREFFCLSDPGPLR